MQVRKWIRKAEQNGWRVTAVRALQLSITCSKQGCNGCKTLPIQNLGDIPAPCDKPHEGQYSAATYQEYKNLVEALANRRQSIGLSQEDLSAATGLADGHINKLESFARTAQFPTLQLWATTLGLTISTSPAPLPAKTLQIIEERTAVPYREEMARHKQPQRSLFNGK